MHTPHGMTCSVKCSQNYSTEVQFIWTPWKVPKGVGLKFFDTLRFNANRGEYHAWKI